MGPEEVNNKDDTASYNSLDLFEDLREYIKKIVPYKDLTTIVKDNDGHIIDRTLSDIKLSRYLHRIENHIQYVKKALRINPQSMLDISTVQNYKYNLWQEFGYISKKINNFINFYGEINNFGKIYKTDPYFRRDYFKIINTLEKAYWLGFLFADASISPEIKTNTNGNQIIYFRFKFSQSIRPKSDNRHIDKRDAIIRLLRALGLCNRRLELFKDYELGFRIQDNDFCEDLINLGLIPGKKKSYNIELPDLRRDDITYVELRNLYLAFLLGYYDGDGTKDATRITCGSRKFLEQIKTLFSIKNEIGSRKGAFYLNLGPEILNSIMDLDFRNSMAYLRRKFALNFDSDDWNEKTFKYIGNLDFLEKCDFTTFIEFLSRPIEITFEKWLRNYFQKAVNCIRYYESNGIKYSIAQIVRDLGCLGYIESRIKDHARRIIETKFGMTFEQLRQFTLFETLPAELEYRRSEF